MAVNNEANVSLEIGYKVANLGGFLAAVNELGMRYMGGVVTGSVTDLVVDEEALSQGIGAEVHQPVLRPLVEIERDPRLTILSWETNDKTGTRPHLLRSASIALNPPKGKPLDKIALDNPFVTLNRLDVRPLGTGEEKEELVVLPTPEDAERLMIIAEKIVEFLANSKNHSAQRLVDPRKPGEIVLCSMSPRLAVAELPVLSEQNVIPRGQFIDSVREHMRGGLVIALGYLGRRLIESSE